MFPSLLSAWFALSPPGDATEIDRPEGSIAPVEIHANEPPPGPADPLAIPAAPNEGGESAPSEADPEPQVRREMDGEPEDDKPDANKKKEKKVKVKVQARVVAGALLTHEEPARDSNGAPVGLPVRKGSLQLRQARVGIDARYRDILRVRVSIDVADLLDSPKPGKVIRNAWANVAIRPAFQIKVGNFKRPYSRLELRGFSSIPFIGRGLFNGFAIEDLGWGDRAVGVSLWGDIEPGKPGLDRFRWQVSATNNALSGAPHGVDAHARVVYDPMPWLSLGINGAFKNIQDPLADEPTCRSTWTRDASCRRNVLAAGGDLAVKIKGLYASVETNLAQDWLYAGSSPWALGVLGYADYEFEVGKRTSLQPVLFGEFIDTNLTYGQSEAVRAGAAFNILWTKHLRVVPQVEFVNPLSPITAFNRFVTRQVYGVWISVQL